MTHPLPEFEVAERNYVAALAVYAGKITSGRASDLERCAADQAAVVLAKARRICARRICARHNGGEQ